MRMTTEYNFMKTILLSYQFRLLPRAIIIFKKKLLH